MIKIKTKTKIGILRTWTAGFFFTLVLCFAFCIPAFATVEVDVIAPGNQPYSFSTDLEVDVIGGPYAGIQFGLTLSSESAVEFKSFEIPRDYVTYGASIYPFLTNNQNVHAFGFFRPANEYQGKIKVGKISFTYTGNDPVVITVSDMKVVRTYDSGNGPSTGGTELTEPALIINLSRGSAEKRIPDTVGVEEQNMPDNTPPVEPPPVVNNNPPEPPPADYTKSKHFSDVGENLFWAFKEIDYLFENGIVTGIGSNIYSPSANIKRGDFLLMLSRAFQLTASPSGNFADVPQGSYYYDAIANARALEIALGDGTNFYPETFITRQDMMVLFDRTLQKINNPLPPGDTSMLSTFVDNSYIEGYARSSVATLVQSGVIKGDGYGINPLGNTTRAEMAVVIYRVLTME